MSRPHASVASAKSRAQAASAAASNPTLDLRHQMEMKKIRETNAELFRYKSKLENLLKQAREHRRESEIRACMSNIDGLTQLADEMKYLERTGDILFQYYSLVDGSDVSPSPVQPATTQSKGILGFFTKQADVVKQEDAEEMFSSEEEEDDDSDLSEDTATLYGPETSYPNPSSVPFVQKDTADLDRASLLDRYMVHTDVNHIPQSMQTSRTTAYARSSSMMMMGATSHHDAQTILRRGTADDSTKSDEPDVCPSCGSKNRRIYHYDGLVSCNDCHVVSHAMIDHDRPSYKDPPKEISYFAYKRINHFQEWISQIQGKESTDIPDQLYDRILLELKKQKITNMALLTRSKLREILKTLRASRFYEHAPHIVNRLNGLPSPHFGHELEETLRAMFRQIQPLFLKYAPSHRKNFLSYAYVLHKFIQLLERDEFLPYFPLLKSREKLHAQDMIWKKMCAELKWQYIPSV